MKLCSACLLGIKCAWDGKDRYKNHKIIELAKKEVLIPVCPEQLGGLPTPRIPAENKADKVITKEGRDVTESFAKGAEEVLRLASLLNIKEAILKQNSPSCGCGKIYDGTFSGKLKQGYGVTAALLKKNGIKVIPDNQI